MRWLRRRWCAAFAEEDAAAAVPEARVVRAARTVKPGAERAVKTSIPAGRINRINNFLKSVRIIALSEVHAFDNHGHTVFI